MDGVRAFRVTHRKCHPVQVGNQYETIEITGTYGETVKRLLLEVGPFILIEHDNDPTPEQLAEVWEWRDRFAKPVVLAARYWLYPVTTGLPEPVCAHRPRFGEWITGDRLEVVQYFGLGCTYLPQELHDLIDPAWDYPALDYQISQAWLDAGHKAYALPLWVEHLHK